MDTLRQHCYESKNQVIQFKKIVIIKRGKWGEIICSMILLPCQRIPV